MSRTDREFIKRQVIEADRLGSLHPQGSFMAQAWSRRHASLEKELAEARTSPPTPRTVLFFAGGEAVIGGRGIDALFAAEILKPFQEMVKSQFATRRHGAVGQRGPRKSEDEARLFLTGLPRGSFGLELSKPLVEDWVQSQQLSATLEQITQAVESAGKSDEDYANAINELSPRVLPRLVEFFEAARKQGISLRMESGDFRCKLSADRIREAFDRTSRTTQHDEVVQKLGLFRGATLDTWKFNFTPDSALPISGDLDDGLDEGTVAAMNLLTNHRCEAQFKQTTLTPPSGAPRLKFELIRLQEVSG